MVSEVLYLARVVLCKTREKAASSVSHLLSRIALTWLKVAFIHGLVKPGLVKDLVRRTIRSEVLPRKEVGAERSCQAKEAIDDPTTQEVAVSEHTDDGVVDRDAVDRHGVGAPVALSSVVWTESQHDVKVVGVVQS